MKERRCCWTAAVQKSPVATVATTSDRQSWPMSSPVSTLERTEIFGPVVIILKFDSLDEAIAAINQHEYGNGASIYTQSGYWARRFKTETLAGMIGINVGIPAPVAYLPFGGMRGSIFADIKGQSKEVVRFFTESKIVTERYWPEDDLGPRA